MLTQNVDAIAIAKASWIAWTICGMIGSTRAGTPPGTFARICGAEVARPGEVEHAAPPDRPAANCVDHRLRDAVGHEPTRQLLDQRVGEDRAGDRQPDRAADLLEERQARRRAADHAGVRRCSGRAPRTARTTARRRGPATTIQSHRIGSSVSARRLVIRNSPTARIDHRPEDDQLVAPGSRDDLPGHRRADDEREHQRQQVQAGLGRTHAATTWNHCGRKTIAPKKPNAARNIEATEIVTIRFRNSSRLDDRVDGRASPTTRTRRR